MPESEELSAKELKYFQAVSKIKANSFFPVDEAMDVLHFLWGESYDDLDLDDSDDLLDIETKPEGDDAIPDMEPADEDLSLTMEAALDDAAKSAEDDLDLDFDIESELQDKDDEIDWLIGLSDEFKKSVKKIDKKVKGRIFEAIEQISMSPVKRKGNTIKPLSAKLKGLWRYRVGDFRLVYMPDSKNRTVTLVVFSARGSAYQ